MAFNPVLRSCEEKDQIGLAGVWSFLQPAATVFEVPDKVIYIRLTLQRIPTFFGLKPYLFTN